MIGHVTLNMAHTTLESNYLEKGKQMPVLCEYKGKWVSVYTNSGEVERPIFLDKKHTSELIPIGSV